MTLRSNRLVEDGPPWNVSTIWCPDYILPLFILRLFPQSLHTVTSTTFFLLSQKKYLLDATVWSSRSRFPLQSLYWKLATNMNWFFAQLRGYQVMRFAWKFTEAGRSQQYWRARNKKSASASKNSAVQLRTIHLMMRINYELIQQRRRGDADRSLEECHH